MLQARLNLVPAGARTSLNWSAVGVLTGLGAVAAIGGIAAFRQRDLVAA